MAEIKSYEDEKEKRVRSGAAKKFLDAEYDRQRKIRAIRTIIVVGLIAVAILFVAIYYGGKTYTGYDTVSSVAREKRDSATDVKLGNSVLTYSQDGAHCVDMKGVRTWNQSYEIQDLKLAVCQNMAAIYGYNGHNIYVQSSESQVGEIQTNLPIKHATVSAAGRVTAVLEDTDVVWLNTYEPDGRNIYEGQYHMSQSGYPCSVSLSPNGDLLAASFIFINEGTMASNVLFFNYGPVGENQSDQLVSTFTYTDMLVPEVHFMNDSSAFAVGDSRLMIYGGEQVPVIKAEHILDREIKGVYYNEEYIGLVFSSDRAEAKYMLKIYNAQGQEVRVHYFDMDYLGLFFEKESFTIYNATECAIYNMNGSSRYEGKFSKNVSLMLPTETPYRYRIVTDMSIDTIQLN